MSGPDVDALVADVKVGLDYLWGDEAKEHSAYAALGSLAALARSAADMEEALDWYAERRNYVPAAPPAVRPPKHLMATDAWDGNGPGARARRALAAASSRERERT